MAHWRTLKKMKLFFWVVVSLILETGCHHNSVTKRKIRIVFWQHTLLPPIVTPEEMPDIEPMPGETLSEEELNEERRLDSIYQAEYYTVDTLPLSRNRMATGQQLFAQWEWRLGGQIINYSTDTLELELPEQGLDTLYYRSADQAGFTQYYLFRFKDGFTYSIGSDKGNASWSIYPVPPKMPFQQLEARFQVENYTGSDRVIGQADWNREPLVLSNQLYMTTVGTKPPPWYSAGEIEDEQWTVGIGRKKR
jgi:hypothetical protein